MTDARTASAAPAANHGWGWLLAYGILAAVLSATAFLWPFSATLAATIVVAAMLFAGGIGSLVAAFRHRGERRAYDIVFGVLSVLVGLFMAFAPAAGAVSITLVLAAWLGARGIMEIYWGVKHRRGRGLMIVLGLVNLVLMAMLFLTLPFAAFVVPGTLLGVSFLFTAIAAISTALDMRRSGAPATV